MIAREVHLDLGRPEVVVATEVQDPVDDVPGGRAGTDMGAARAIPEAFEPCLTVAVVPVVIARPADPKISASLGDVFGDFLSMPKPGKPELNHPIIVTHGAPPRLTALPRCVTDVLQS